MNRLRIFLFLLIWLLPALGCNMPTGTDQSAAISEAALRQTLAAQAELSPVTTAQPGSGEITPQVGSTPINGQLTATPGINPTPPGTAGVLDLASNSWTYYARPGDTLPAIASRFGVDPELVGSEQPIPAQAFIDPGQRLMIPNALGNTLPGDALLPDSEVINSPTSAGFDTQSFITQSAGYLSRYQEIVDDQALSGAQIVERVALESSVSPRFLLAFLEFRSGWVRGEPEDQKSLDYPIGFRVPDNKGLYLELVLTATHLNAGYYGWRNGTLTTIKFSDGSTGRPQPTLNAGSIALQHLFAKFFKRPTWTSTLYDPGSFLSLYRELFGDAWGRDAQIGALFPKGLTQPVFELPFIAGERWSLTGGPHYSWNTGSPRGALDFAPVTGEPACAVSRAWATASAAGFVVRAANNVVVLDLDGDGYEQTGWTIVYVHLAAEDLISNGTQVNLDDPLGHPSCERGTNTGTHVHIARKYNGEWIAADGPLPFVLSGWIVHAGAKNYQGELLKGDQTVTSNPGGNRSSIITR